MPWDAVLPRCEALAVEFEAFRIATVATFSSADLLRVRCFPTWLRCLVKLLLARMVLCWSWETLIATSRWHLILRIHDLSVHVCSMQIIWVGWTRHYRRSLVHLSWMSITCWCNDPILQILRALLVPVVVTFTHKERRPVPNFRHQNGRLLWEWFLLFNVNGIYK